MAIKRLAIGRLINGLLLTLLGIIMLYPFWYVACYALSTYQDVLKVDFLLWPANFTLENVSFILSTGDFLNIYKNTLVVVVGGTILSMVATIGFSYALSRDVPGHKWISAMTFFTLIFAGGMIPSFLVVRSTGLLNSLWALIIPRLVDPFNIFLMRNFFRGIPRELDESAGIDGAGTIRIMVSIILPLALPGIATVCLFYAVGYWNQFFEALLYTSNRPQWTLQVMLNELLVSSQTDAVGSSSSSDNMGAALSTSVKMASVLVTVVPILCVYPFLQRYFVKGVIVGAVKG
jgi:putative aldouronate transport system permease protein